MNTWPIASFLKENVGPFRDVSTGAARRSLGRLKSGETFNALVLATGHLVIADFIAPSRCELRSGILLPGNLKQRNNGS